MNINSKISCGLDRKLQPHISDEEWNKPIFFEAYPLSEKEREKIHSELLETSFPLYGMISSMYLGEHVGWKVNGVDYPRDRFEEHYFRNIFTGFCPVGLTPK